MKGLFKFLDALAGVILILGNLLEILAFPALLVLVGLLNSYPWQYYALTIGGYFVIAAVLQLTLHLVFKKLEKKIPLRWKGLYKGSLLRKRTAIHEIRIKAQHRKVLGFLDGYGTLCSNMSVPSSFGNGF